MLEEEILNEYKYTSVYCDSHITLVQSQIKVAEDRDIECLDSLELADAYIGDTLEDVFLVFPQLDTYNINSDGTRCHIVKGVNNVC